jgi:ubiquinone/menaquinone biosynthesis C-methylase UbiE
MVAGVDPDPRVVSFASQSYGGERLTFQAADFRQLPFPDESFDLVVSLGLFPSSEGADSLDEILRVLRPSGSLLIAGLPENRKALVHSLEERFETVSFWGQRPELGKTEITDEFAIESLGATDDAFLALAESLQVEEPLAVGAAGQGSLRALHPSAASGPNGR